MKKKVVKINLILLLYIKQTSRVYEIELNSSSAGLWMVHWFYIICFNLKKGIFNGCTCTLKKLIDYFLIKSIHMGVKPICFISYK